MYVSKISLVSEQDRPSRQERPSKQPSYESQYGRLGKLLQFHNKAGSSLGDFELDVSGFCLGPYCEEKWDIIKVNKYN